MVKKRKISWNKGLTKYDHTSIERISVSRLGDKNPMKRPEVIRKMSLTNKGSTKFTKNLGKYAIKGNEMSQQIKDKISNSLKGNTHSKGCKQTEESNRKRSLALKGRKCPPFTEEHKKNMSKALKGKKLTEYHKNNISQGMKGEKNPFYGKKHTNETKLKQSLIKKDKSWEELYGEGKAKEMKRKCSLSRKGEKNYMYGESPSKEVTERNRQSNKANWRNPLFVKKMKEIRNVKPNDFEKGFMNFLDKYFPNQFRYVGDFKFWVGGKNPDFIHKDKKVCIEIFYTWFKVRYFGSVEIYKKEREEHFSNHGWRTLFFDEQEVLDKANVVAKIKSFVGVFGV